MKEGIAILWVIVFVLSIVLIVLSSRVLIRKYHSIDPNVEEVRDICLLSPSAPEISNLPCCRIDGQVTDQRYVPQLNLVVANSAQPYATACAGFCTYGVNNQGQCNGGIGQMDYSRCLSLTRPSNCIGSAKPVARIGEQSYYAIAATNATCLETAPC